MGETPTTERGYDSVKCVAVGDAAVGKTCLLIVYTTQKIPPEYIPTVFDNYETKIEINGESFTFQLWDTAGAEHYDVLRPLSYNETDVFLVVYSVIDRKSFENVDKKWVADITAKGDKGVPYVIVGNKVDLRDDESAQGDKPITTEEGEGMRLKCGAANFFETSAYKQTGIKPTFDTCVALAFDRLQVRKREREEKMAQPEVPDIKKSKGVCCTLV